MLVGFGALAILIVLARTRVAIVSAVVALVIPSLAVIVFGLDSVAKVEDGGDIPVGFPAPRLPDFGLLSLDLIVGAPSVDGHYAGAGPASFIEGVGLTCSAPPSGYVRDGFADTSGRPGGVYPYYAKAGR